MQKNDGRCNKTLGINCKCGIKTKIDTSKMLFHETPDIKTYIYIINIVLHLKYNSFEGINNKG